jgi:hypothetical protein
MGRADHPRFELPQHFSQVGHDSGIVRIPEREVEDQASFRGCRRLKQFMAEQDAFCRVVMRERESVGNEQGLVSVIIRPMTRW